MAIDLKNPNHQRAVLSSLGLVAVAYLYFGASFVPGNYLAREHRLAQLKAKFQSLSSDLTKARQAAASLDRLEAESRKLHEQWAVVREELPDQKELAGLLRKITLAGSQAGVHFQLFKPDAPVPNQYYTDNPVHITVVGAYHQVGGFLSEIAGMGRLVNSHDLDLSTATRDNTDITTQATFVASAYTLGGTEPATSATAKGPATKGAASNAKNSLAKVTP